MSGAVPAGELREQIAQIVARAYGGSLYPGLGTPGDYPTADVDYRAADAILDHFPDVGKMMPAGWVLVPVEPTPEMRKAGEAEMMARHTNLDCFNDPYVDSTYAAMLAATPTPPPSRDADVERLKQALEDVCNPLGYLKRMADAEGAKLGGMAYSIANDISTVQGIARAALQALGERG